VGIANSYNLKKKKKGYRKKTLKTAEHRWGIKEGSRNPRGKVNKNKVRGCGSGKSTTPEKIKAI